MLNTPVLSIYIRLYTLQRISQTKYYTPSSKEQPEISKTVFKLSKSMKNSMFIHFVKIKRKICQKSFTIILFCNYKQVNLRIIPAQYMIWALK